MKSISTITVGVDVAKDTLEVFIHPINERLSVDNSRSGIRFLLSQIRTHKVKSIICEASGGYEFLLKKASARLNYDVWVADPRRIKAFIRSEGQRAKTDKIDAEMIARFGASNNPPQHYGKQTDHLRQLVRRFKQLKRMIADEERRIQHPQLTHGAALIQKHISFMKKAVEKIEQQMAHEIKNNDHYAQKATILKSMPGIGPVAATTLLACMPELGLIGNKQAASLVGVAPFARQSGLYKGQSRIAGGRSTVRNILYMCAMTAIRYNKRFKEFYQRLIKRGKCGKVALIAVIRKMVVSLNAMLQKEELWSLDK